MSASGSILDLMKGYMFTFLGQGLLITLWIAVATVALSSVIGTLAGVMRYSRHPILGWIGAAYVEIFRNLPVILLILACRFMSGMKPMTSAIVALTLYTSAVLAEVVRGGLNSIPTGQWEAARAQGFTYLETLRYIVLPQALRKMIPPIFSQFTTVVKDTSFAWIVQVEELTGKGVIISGQYGSTGQFFAIFGFIGFVYFVVNFLMMRVARHQEARLSVQ